jgi:hypothetical protein
VIIFTIAERSELLWILVSGSWINGHTIEIRLLLQLLLLCTVKIEGIPSCNDQFLIISWHISDFIDHEIESSSAQPLSFDEHIVCLNNALIYPVSYTNSEIFIIFTEAHG